MFRLIALTFESSQLQHTTSLSAQALQNKQVEGGEEGMRQIHAWGLGMRPITGRLQGDLSCGKVKLIQAAHNSLCESSTSSFPPLTFLSPAL